MIRCACVVLICSAVFGSSIGGNPGELSKQKCQEYSKFGLDENKKCVFPVQDLFSNQPPQLKEFPHTAYIGLLDGDVFKQRCTGTIISERYILTAAHCLMQLKGKYLISHVKVGLINNDDTAHAQFLKIEGYINHPEYILPSQHNDIGLLKLEKDIEFNAFVRPACLNTLPTISESKAVVTGWGRIKRGEDNTKNLTKVGFEFTNIDDCNEVYKPFLLEGNELVGDKQLCAKSLVEGTDTCTGFGGGPLQIIHDSSKDQVNCMFDVVGIVSFGPSSCDGKIPGVFTKVATYLKWIEDNAWSQ